MAEAKKTNEIIKKKIKAIYPHITVTGDVDKPYYNIDWYDIKKKTMYRGYSSYDLKLVKKWLQEDFEVVENYIADLINRQKAENQNLKGHLEQLKSRYDNAKAEIERLESNLKFVRGTVSRQAEQIEILSKNADTAFQDGLNEAQALYAEQVKAEIRAEAIKEFAGLVDKDIDKKLSESIKTQNPHLYLIHQIVKDRLKEMVGEE